MPDVRCGTPAASPKDSLLKRAIPAVFLALLLAAGIMWSKRQQLLIHAAVRGDVAILNGLLAVGADPNSTVTGSSPCTRRSGITGSTLQPP